MMNRRISRQLRKVFGIEDAEAGFARLEELAAQGDLPPELQSLAQNFRAFCRSIHDAYDEDAEKVHLAVRNLELSSEELNGVNAELNRLNIANRAMLESLGQGLLFFGRDGLCSNIFSEACLTLLEGNPAGRHICDVLQLPAEKRENFEPLISLMFDSETMALSFTDLVAMAPQSYEHSKGLHIALSYKAMYGHNGRMMGILLVATDITQKIKAQKLLEDKEQQVLRTLRIAGNRGNFVHTLESFHAVFSTFDSAETLGDFKRDLHTLKGMARVFYLSDMAALLHEIEGRLPSLPQEGWKAALKKMMEEYKDRIGLSLDYATWLGREIWGDAFEGDGNFITVSTETLYDFGQALHALPVAEAGGLTRRYFEQVASVPVASQLDFFETQLLYFAEVADRQVRILRQSGDEVRIFPDIYRGVFDALTHAARNIVDHAWEPPAQRRERSKTPELRVSVKTTYTDDSRTAFRIEIGDDGQGVSVSRVMAKLKQRDPEASFDGIPPEQIIQHVFDPEFSTRSEVSLDAGRGVGMNVIKTAVERLGGTVHIDSREGQGSTLVLQLPVVWQKS